MKYYQNYRKKNLFLFGLCIYLFSLYIWNWTWWDFIVQTAACSYLSSAFSAQCKPFPCPISLSIKIPILSTIPHTIFYLFSLSLMAHLDQNLCWRKTPPKPKQNINGSFSFFVIRKSREEEIHKMSSCIQPHTSPLTRLPQIPSCLPYGVLYLSRLLSLKESRKESVWPSFVPFLSVSSGHVHRYFFYLCMCYVCGVLKSVFFFIWACAFLGILGFCWVTRIYWTRIWRGLL